MSWIVTDRSHQTFNFSFGQVTAPSGEAMRPLGLSKDFDPTPPHSHKLIINHMKLSCREEKKRRGKSMLNWKASVPVMGNLLPTQKDLSSRISLRSALSLALINILINDLDDERKRS